MSSAATFFPLQHGADAIPTQLQKRVLVRAKRSRGKAVTWPPEDQICQVRFFLSNDLPSTIGSAQNVMQMNQMRKMPSQNKILGMANTLPELRGSLVKRPRVTLGNEAFMAIGTPWDCPKKFVYDVGWFVADGDESKEAGFQQQREPRVLEAFYPRSTAIPDSPAEPVEICTALLDSPIPTIPLVPIEEEGDDNGESEHESKSLHNLDELPERGKSMEVCQPDFPAPKPSSMPSQEQSQDVHDSFIGSADAKVAVAAAAAAACMALHKHGSANLVDPDLLVEILRNPVLLKSLPLYNGFSRNPAVATYGLKPSFAGQLSCHQFLQHDGPPNKASTAAAPNTGLPSPVSVLSDWTQQEHTALLPTKNSNPSETFQAGNLPAVSCALTPNVNPNHSCKLCSTQEGALQLESVRVDGFRVAPEGRMGKNVSSMPSATVQMTSVVHPDRSRGLVAPAAPFPPQNVGSFPSKLPGRLHQPALGPPPSSQGGVMHHQSTAPLDPCRSSLPEARFRGGKESAGSCFATKAGPKTTRVCMYFNTPRGCRNGGNCAFLHQSGSPELNAFAQRAAILPSDVMVPPSKSR